ARPDLAVRHRVEIFPERRPEAAKHILRRVERDAAYQVKLTTHFAVLQPQWRSNPAVIAGLDPANPSSSLRVDAKQDGCAGQARGMTTDDFEQWPCLRALRTILDCQANFGGGCLANPHPCAVVLRSSRVCRAGMGPDLAEPSNQAPGADRPGR